MSASTGIRSLILPLEDSVLVVPASAVEEVLFAEPLDLPAPAAPEWLMGEVQLRHQPIPLIAFETLVGGPAMPIPASVHAVVLKNLSADAEPSLYALRLARAPRVEELDTGTLQLAEDGQSDNAYIACRVIVDGEEGGVPALDKIVEALQEYMVSA